jgi:hypothetical protein
MSFSRSAKPRLEATRKEKNSGSSSPLPKAGSLTCVVSSAEDHLRWEPELVNLPMYVQVFLFLLARVFVFFDSCLVMIFVFFLAFPHTNLLYR